MTARRAARAAASWSLSRPTNPGPSRVRPRSVPGPSRSCLGHRQAHGELAAAPGAFAAHLHAAAVQLDVFLDQRQAQAEAGARAGLAVRALGEEVEHARLQLGRDAVALVHDAQYRLLALGGALDPDVRALGGELRGVGDEDRKSVV